MKNVKYVVIIYMSDINFQNPFECAPFGVYSVVAFLFIVVNLMIYFYKYNTFSTMVSFVCNFFSSAACAVILLNLCTIPIGSMVGWFLVVLSIFCMFSIIIMAMSGYGGFGAKKNIEEQT